MVYLSVLFLIISLAVILYSCELFTNGIEWFGDKLNFSQGVIGSVLAAVGTALPETMIPIIAILFGVSASSHEVGVGAIAGAPLMLSTLAMFVTGLAVVVFTITKRRKLNMDVDTEIMSRDLRFFLLTYTLAILTAFVPGTKLSSVRIFVGIFLVLAYGYYVYVTFKDKTEEDGDNKLEELTFSKYFRLKNSLGLIIVQVLLALTGIVVGAKFFVDNMTEVATLLNVSPLILSIILTPIATELPEKFNSIIWISKKKDTLALGNITGAMVFQSCFPVAFGVVFTDWNITGVTLLSAILAISSGAANYIYLKVKKTLNPIFLLLSGIILYGIFIAYVFIS